MATQDLKIFPVSVRSINNFLTADECNTIIESQVDEHFGRHNALPGGSKSSWTYYTQHKNNDFLDQIDVKLNFIQRIETEVLDFAKLYFIDSLKVSKVWTNVQTAGTKLLPHTHPTSVISGALYLKCDDNSSGLCFLNPQAIDKDKFVVKPEVGTLVLFPGWLMHGSDGVNQSEQRIVLSFNTEKK